MSDYSQSRTEHYRMSYIAESQAHGTGNSKPLTQSHSLQDQAHLMALTSEWGHSVFELHGSRENIERSHGKHVTDVAYKMPIYDSQNISSMIHNTEEPTYVRPSYMYRQESHADDSGHSYPVQEKLKEEPEDSNYVEYISPKIDGHKSESLLGKEDRPCSPELPKLKKCSPETDIIEKSPRMERVESPKCRSSQWKATKLSEEEISAKRAAQAAAQREVRRRRREKMSEEERLSELATLAASQRESRRRQREKMTEEELHLRRTLSAITQREIRRRRMSNMNEEELKTYRAREAQRQKELRHRKRMAMTEEELKIVKAKEAAASAARRARRLGKEVKSRLKVDKPDSSPS